MISFDSKLKKAPEMTLFLYKFEFSPLLELNMPTIHAKTLLLGGHIESLFLVPKRKFFPNFGEWP